MHVSKDSMWREILKSFCILGGSKQGHNTNCTKTTIGICIVKIVTVQKDVYMIETLLIVGNCIDPQGYIYRCIYEEIWSTQDKVY